MQLKTMFRPALFPFLRVRAHQSSARPGSVPAPGRTRPSARSSEFSKTRRLPAGA